MLRKINFTGINIIKKKVKRRRWTWLGNALRMNKSRLQHVAFRWEMGGTGTRREPWKRKTRSAWWPNTRMTDKDMFF